MTEAGADLSTAALQGPSVLARSCDVVVVGGGPAGSAAASFLARQGRSVVLFERDVFPRRKLCGEFLSGEALDVLEELGCREEVEAAGTTRIARARITSPSGASAVVAMPREGLGVCRRTLDPILLANAARSGAAVYTGAVVRAVHSVAGADRNAAPVEVEVRLQVGAARVESRRVACQLVVAAHGRREPLDAALGRSLPADAGRLVGFGRHHRLRPGRVGECVAAALAGVVEVHAFAGGYCGLAAVGGASVNVCMLIDARVLRQVRPARWEPLARSLAAANRLLGERLLGLEPEEEQALAIAGVSLEAKDLAQGRVFFVGDAAGMIAPLSGDGQAMALDGARRLARLFLAAPSAASDPECLALARSWQRQWRRAYARRLRAARWLEALLTSPWRAEAVVRAAKLMPRIGAWVAAATRG